MPGFSRSEGSTGVSDAIRLETMVKTGFAEGDPFFSLFLHAEFLLTSQGVDVCVSRRQWIPFTVHSLPGFHCAHT